MPGRLDALTLRDCQPRRIWILKPSALGDVVQSLPVLPALRARWPHAAITWVIRDDLSELVAGHPLIDEWLPFHRHGGALSFFRLLRRLRRRRFDLVIDLQGLLRTGLMAQATAAPLRVGLETAREGAALAHNIILPHTGRDVPAHARSQRLVDVLSLDRPSARERHSPCLLPPSLTGPSDLNAAVPLAAGHSSVTNPAAPLLAVHPGGRWPSKRWPLGRFASVTGRAVRELQARVVVVGSPSERTRSRSFVASLRAAAPACDVEDLSGTTSLSELSAVLRAADLLLTGDSGPLHLAAALGIPVVGVYTSTSPVLSGPPPSASSDATPHQLVAAPTRCAGCYRRNCPLPEPTNHACHRDLTVERVWQALMESLRRSGRAGEAAVPTDTAPSIVPLRLTRLAAAEPAARRRA